MTDIEKIISIAQKEVGTVESPAGSNNVKYNTWWYGHQVSGSKYPWCVTFVAWVFEQAGLSKLFNGGNKTASCTSLMNYHKANGQVVTSGYQSGDLLLFQFDKDKYPDHIGICKEVNGSRVKTIEGNTSITSDDSGGCVMERNRPLSCVLCAVRLCDTTNSSKDASVSCVASTPLKTSYKPSNVKLIQSLLNETYGMRLTVDGICGTQTKKAIIRAVQKELNTRYRKSLIVDGIWGPVTKAAFPNVTVCSKSNLVRIVQMCISIKQQEIDIDGIFGTETLKAVKKFQEEHDLKTDGVVGKNTMESFVK